MTTLDKHLMAELRADLASFADTHSRLDLEEDRAAWTRQGTCYQADLLQSAGYPDVRLNGHKQSWPDFLASDRMANLAALAESIYFSGSDDNDKYIEPRVETDDEGRGQAKEGQAKEIVGKLVSDLPHGATRVVFLRGDAGAGKTVALRHMAHSQADAYLSNGAKFLYLYIDAQARYLARLDDAVALVLQDLNARFTYRALATLTKHRLVVPIIDGFDELLGAGGAGEAVDALTQFLARLGGRGATVASARSAYFDFGQIRRSADRLRSSETSFAIVPVELQPWTKHEMRAYLKKGNQFKKLGAPSPAAALEALERTFSGNADSTLFSTPFFLAAAVETAREPEQDEPIKPEHRPIRRIIDSFVRREVGKHLDANDQPLLTEDNHWRFLRMLAEEMWWQERRELDKASVDAIAELFADDVGMAGPGLRAFVSRASSYAFLASQNRASDARGPRMLAFSHEYYYAFFVGLFLADALVRGSDVAGLLGRTQVSPTVATEFAAHVGEESRGVTSVLSALAARRVPGPTRDTNRDNTGALYTALLRKHQRISDLHLVDASFTGADFRDTRQENVRVENCNFVDTDFRGARWSFNTSEQTTFGGLHVDASTKLSGLRLEIGTDLYGIKNQTGGTARVEYDPAKVASICEKLGISALSVAEAAQRQYSDKAERTIDLLHKLLRVSERMYYLSDGILRQRGISSSPFWQDLEKLLRRHRLLEDKQIQKRGPDAGLSRLAYPPGAIAEGEGRTTHPEIREFWKAIREL